MKFSIIIPHYKTGMMTAYSIAQLLKYRGEHELKIIVINNNLGDGSEKYLEPFKKNILLVDYPKGLLQSHGIAIDYAIPGVDTDYFITMESDSFPTNDRWLDYYKDLIYAEYDAVGSLLVLSGGKYMHPCGGLFKTSIWYEAYKYLSELPYFYYPNFMMRDNFPIHTMIEWHLSEQVEINADDWVELSAEYKGPTKKIMKERQRAYMPACGPFHSGVGFRQESIKTYGQRTPESETPFVLKTEKSPKIIGRMGYEPGQFLHYFILATGKKVYYIPTETIWMPGKENQQQEKTVMENGFTHLWGISAYHDFTPEQGRDIAIYKQSLPEKLYNTLPAYLKVD